ncbi:type IV pilus modification protein PilV [Janthinobacterium agaricidamnosum NBRC 102515 = DSM 9628]|uniref:Type IV pilus modification protein PilV n=1 Tax=Janthinobacterium agaricidamnosum NBRC 102515 = DSM 9628 TaxID=1349767 RepID=W0V7C2_9BURK|nr:type IV pilus modification protein PilV [Janthinobacterium agaricidamnosum NBRC 102515 = DSM 9628]
MLEALIASLILAIGLLGAIGLQARAYSAMSDAGLRAEAAMATDKLFGVLANDQPNLSGYALAEGGAPGDRLKTWYANTRTVIPGATISIVITPNADATRNTVVATIKWTRKDGGAPNVHSVTSYVGGA